MTSRTGESRYRGIKKGSQRWLPPAHACGCGQQAPTLDFDSIALYVTFHFNCTLIIDDQQIDMSSTPALFFRFLRAGQVKQLNRMIEQTASFCRDETMLQSALDAPENQQHYMNVHEPALLATILSSRLIKNHPFANGNKRTALLAASLFLMQSGQVIRPDAFGVEPNDVITKAHADIAMGEMDEAELADLCRKSFHDATAGNRIRVDGLAEEAGKDELL